MRRDRGAAACRPSAGAGCASCTDCDFSSVNNRPHSSLPWPPEAACRSAGLGGAVAHYSGLMWLALPAPDCSTDSG